MFILPIDPHFACTFGPSWVHLYGSHGKADHAKSINAGYGQGHVYCGKLLVTVQAETTLNDEASQLHKSLDYEPKSSDSLFVPSRQNYLLFATIFDANMIEQKKSYKLLNFEISLGHNGAPEDVKKSKTWQTDSYRPERIEPESGGGGTGDTSKYCRLNFGMESETKKPCMHLTASLPDHEYRIKNRVQLKNIVTKLETDVKRIINDYENSLLVRRSSSVQQQSSSSKDTQLLVDIKLAVGMATMELKKTLNIINLENALNVNELDRKLMTKRMKLIVSHSSHASFEF